MTDHNHRPQHEPYEVSGLVWGYIEYLLADPMTQRHNDWLNRQQYEADIAEQRRTNAPGYDATERLP